MFEYKDTAFFINLARKCDNIFSNLGMSCLINLDFIALICYICRNKHILTCLFLQNCRNKQFFKFLHAYFAIQDNHRNIVILHKPQNVFGEIWSFPAYFPKNIWK